MHKLTLFNGEHVHYVENSHETTNINWATENALRAAGFEPSKKQVDMIADLVARACKLTAHEAFVTAAHSNEISDLDEFVDYCAAFIHVETSPHMQDENLLADLLNEPLQ